MSSKLSGLERYYYNLVLERGKRGFDGWFITSRVREVFKRLTQKGYVTETRPYDNRPQNDAFKYSGWYWYAR